MKQLRCKYCNKIMAQIENGSKLHHKLICICSDCDDKRMKEIKTLRDSLALSIENKQSDYFDDLLCDFFKRAF